MKYLAFIGVGLFSMSLSANQSIVDALDAMGVEKRTSSVMTLAQGWDSQEFDDYGGRSRRSSRDTDLDLDDDSFDNEDGVDLVDSESFDEADFSAPRRSSRRSKPRRSSRRNSRRRSQEGYRESSGGSVRSAMEMLRSGDGERASEILFSLSRSGSHSSSRDRLKYLTGLALMQLNLNQSAAFQFVGIVKKGGGRFNSRALEKLSVVASRLGDSTLIDYAISRMKARRYSEGQKDLLNFRTGEYLLRKGENGSAARFFKRVRRSSQYYYQAKYKEGLAYAKAGRVRSSLRAFNRIIRDREDGDPDDVVYVTSLLARARVLYQGKKWKAAIDAYRDIPRQSIYWHDALFEKTWAFLMSAKFRSALSTFHSLHSPFYEKFFLPESLVLRSIVYLYICNYEEMEKTAKLFDRLYTPILDDLNRYLRSGKSDFDYFDDFNRFLRYWQGKKSDDSRYKGDIPEMIGRHLLKDGDIKQLYKYLGQLRKEQRTWSRLGPEWQSSGVGEYSRRAIKKRLEKVSKKIGARVRIRLRATSDQLQEYVEQNGFLRFEMLSAKKRQIKKRIRSGEKKKKETIDQDDERDFYAQNGYDYWPFKGEYWLDELGNYHFLGVQRCD